MPNVSQSVLGRSGSEESIQWESRRSCASAPSLSFHPMPFRITQESYRPRVSYRTMVGALPPALLASFRSRMASTTIRVMKPSECEQLGLTLRREKAIQTKWQSGEGAGCRRNSTVSGGGRRMSLDIPFYRTPRATVRHGWTRLRKLGCAVGPSSSTRNWTPCRRCIERYGEILSRRAANMPQQSCCVRFLRSVRFELLS